MPTKRRTPKMTAHRVTAEAVEAFRAGERMRLHTLLDLRPWQVSLLEVNTSYGEGKATGRATVLSLLAKTGATGNSPACRQTRHSMAI